MTMEQVLMGIFITLGIVMLAIAIIGLMYFGLLLPFAIFLILGGIAIIIVTIVIGFLIL